MKGAKQGEVILFPKTLDYYQIQLTKMLETESYGEAIRLLRFLLQCKTWDERIENEWSTLLQWLVKQFPDAEASLPEDDEDNAGEEELLRRTVTAKSNGDRAYALRLLNAIEHTSLEKQMLAIDQLAYVEDSTVPGQLLDKLQSVLLHPFAQFKLLQTLCKLGMRGEATFGKLGEIVTVDIEHTPLSYDQFPETLIEIGERVQLGAEVNDPTLSYFAVQTWMDFLKYYYGTSIYREMTQAAEAQTDLWAAALHATVSEAMRGAEAEIEDALDLYGVTGADLPEWERACGALRKYFRDGGNVNV
jgi:hypothetical protein